jgi:hypothetical protein
MAIPVQVTFDCADPARVASLWSEALGYKLQDPPEGYASWPYFLTAIGVPEADWNKASAIVAPEGCGPRIYFHRVPEPKMVKNRVHLDVNVGGGLGTPIDERRARVDSAVERLCGIGATKLRPYEEHSDMDPMHCA